MQYQLAIMKLFQFKLQLEASYRIAVEGNTKIVYGREPRFWFCFTNALRSHDVTRIVALRPAGPEAVAVTPLGATCDVIRHTAARRP